MIATVSDSLHGLAAVILAVNTLLLTLNHRRVKRIETNGNGKKEAR